MQSVLVREYSESWSKRGISLSINIQSKKKYIQYNYAPTQLELSSSSYKKQSLSDLL